MLLQSPRTRRRRNERAITREREKEVTGDDRSRTECHWNYERSLAGKANVGSFLKIKRQIEIEGEREIRI